MRGERKTFDNAVKLDHRVAIYVPGTKSINQQADNAEYIYLVAASFSRWFGGCSAETVSGYWMTNEGELVEEQTTIVYSSCTEEAQADHIRDVERLAERIKAGLSQEAVSVEIDHTLYII